MTWIEHIVYGVSFETYSICINFTKPKSYIVAYQNNLNLYMSIIYQVIAFSLHSLVVKRKSLSFTCRFAKKHMS